MAGYLSILVVLDVVLEDNDMSLAVIGVKTFNPCCAGCSSGRKSNYYYQHDDVAFNPCCAGCSSGSILQKKL